MFSSYKKIFLLGFILVILIAIPFSVYLVQKRQQITSKAAASTVLSFDPASSTVKVGDIVTLSIMLDPGTGASANQVSFVKLSIKFDPTKFAIIGESLKPNPEPPNTLTTIVEDPKYESGATISLSIGADPTKAVITKTKIAILQLKAIAETSPVSPNLTFDSAPATQVLSIALSDQTSENVLSTTVPAKITIVSALANITVTPTLNPSLAPTLNPTAAPFPSTPVPTSGGISPTPLSVAPVCSSLEINGPVSGTTPYSLMFTAIGSDADGTIKKVSFNFGDSVEDLTSGGGIGTNSVRGLLPHTYATPGIYTAYAILTDNSNNLSAQQTSCTKTITVNSLPTQPPIPTIIVQPSIEPPGDGKIMFGLGALGVIFTIIGGALLLF